MKKLHYFIPLLLGAFIFSACHVETPRQKNTNNEYVTTLHHRAYKGSIHLTDPEDSEQGNNLRNESRDQGPATYIGRAYLPQLGLYTSEECLGANIFDIRELYNENPKWFQQERKREITSDYMVFSGSSSFSEKVKLKTNLEGKLEASFLELYTVGAELTFGSAFNYDQKQQDKYTQAYYNINCIDTRYTLLASQPINKRIGNKYLSQSFRHLLYNRPTNDIFSKPNENLFSPYILTEYLTGGQANILINARNESNTTATANESKLNFAVSGKILGMAKGSLAIAFDEQTQNELKRAFSSISISSRIMGGRFTTGFQPSSSIENFHLDLTDWVNDFNQTRSYSLGTMGGKRPYITNVSNFIPEENLRQQVYYHSYCDKFIEPYIEIVCDGTSIRYNKFEEKNGEVKFDFEKAAPIYMILHTRMDDKLYLRPFNATDEAYWSSQNSEDFAVKAKRMKEYAMQYYDLTIKQRVVRGLIEVSGSLIGRNKLSEKDFKDSSRLSVNWIHNSSEPIIWYTLKRDIKIDLFGLDESKFFRAKHPNYYNPQNYDFMQYLCYNDGKHRYAFAIYKEYLLYTYGIKALFYNAPEKPLKDYELEDYTIIAL